MWHLDVHSGVPSNWWILVSCETKSLLLFSCTVPSPGLGKRLCCTEKCTDCTYKMYRARMALALAGLQPKCRRTGSPGWGERSWQEELEVGCQHGNTGSSSKAQSSAVPPTPACAGSARAQSLCTEMHLLCACHRLQVVGRASWSCSEYISLISPQLFLLL